MRRVLALAFSRPNLRDANRCQSRVNSLRALGYLARAARQMRALGSRQASGPDGAFGYQLVALCFAEAEQLAEDVVEIFADFGRYRTDFS
jgi:hypothetical protein